MPRSAAAAASSSVPLTWRRSGTPRATASWTNPSPAEPVEHRARRCRARGRAGRRPSGRAASSWCSAVSLAAAHQARGDGRRRRTSGPAAALVERGGDDADAAVGRLGDAVGVDRRAGREHVDDLRRRSPPARRLSMISPSTSCVTSCRASARRRPATIRRHAPSASSMRSRAASRRRRSAGGRRRSARGRMAAASGRQRTEVAAQAHDVVGRQHGAPATTCRTPPAPRAARRGGTSSAGQPGEQRGAGQAHSESPSSLLTEARTGAPSTWTASPWMTVSHRRPGRMPASDAK